ncbi:hypothetical protein [Rhizobacter sp. P5_C2]
MRHTSSPPRLTAFGLYSPVQNRAEYERFVERRAAERDPANYSQETIDFLTRCRREVPRAHTEADRQEIWEEFESSLAMAVLVEVLAENVDSKFDVGDFVQFDPGVREGWSQCAWQETYLTDDGSAVLSGQPPPKAPLLPRFRVAFYIHNWRRRLGLLSSYGCLELPRVKPMPKRLWELVPYQSVG